MLLLNQQNKQLLLFIFIITYFILLIIPCSSYDLDIYQLFNRNINEIYSQEKSTGYLMDIAILYDSIYLLEQNGEDGYDIIYKLNHKNGKTKAIFKIGVKTYLIFCYLLKIPYTKIIFLRWGLPTQ